MSSGELSDRERSVLSHLGRHRIAFQEVLRALFFRGADPQKTLNRLRTEGYIGVSKGFGGNRSCYQLLRKGASAVGLGRRRADALGSDAFPTYLAIYSFCFLRGLPRIRLEPGELEELFDGAEPPGRHYCLERSKDRKRIYHVYVPGDTTTPSDVVAHVGAHINTISMIDALRPWIGAGLFSEAVLVHAPDRRNEIRRTLEAARAEAGPVNRDRVYVHVESVPGIGNLEEALRVLAEKTKADRPRAGGVLSGEDAGDRLQGDEQVRTGASSTPQSDD